MPRKVRQLMAILEKAGFENRSGKGAHRNYLHSSGAKITLSGNRGDDAQRYQEKDVARAVRQAQAKAN